MVRAGVWDFPVGDPSRADRSGMWMLGVGATIPNAGVLDARARAELSEGEAALDDGEQRRRALLAALRHVCVRWAAASEEANAWTHYEASLDALARALEARQTTGTVASFATLEIERTGARRSRARVEALAEAMAELLTTRAALGPDRLATPRLGEVERVASVTDSPRDLAELRAGEARLEAARARAEAASSAASTPAVSVEATYMQVPGERAGLALEVRASLPWLGGAPAEADAARDEASARAAELAAMREDLQAERIAARGLVDATRIDQRQLEAETLPAARRALEVTLDLFARGEGSLEDAFEAARRTAALEVELVRVSAELAHASVDVAALEEEP